MRRAIVSLAAVAAIGTATASAESPQQAFIRSWEGRTVVVRNTLYTLVYNERGKLGNIRTAKRDGLIVATPSHGMYFQFDGRQGRDDVVERDPLRVIAAVSAAYEPDSLELRSYRKVEPVIINRYDPGVGSSSAASGSIVMSPLSCWRRVVPAGSATTTKSHPSASSGPRRSPGRFRSESSSKT